MSNKKDDDPRVSEALALLGAHFDAFSAAASHAARTGHPVPTDTRGWSQVLVSILYGVNGLARKKGADLDDGSDVKGANTWNAIDTPRFNSVLKSGTKAIHSGKMESLDNVPYLFLVLWDHAATSGNARCRIWSVRAQHDKIFRAMCKRWYGNCVSGKIKSHNFQLHPPRGEESNVIRNTCGNLEYPLYFRAERPATGRGTYTLIHFDPEVLKSGLCKVV